MINLISLVDCINFSYYNLKESGPVPREKLPCETIADNNRPAQECKSQILVSLRVFRTSRIMKTLSVESQGAEESYLTYITVVVPKGS